MYVTVKCGGIVGGGGTIKQFLLMCLLICGLFVTRCLTGISFQQVINHLSRLLNFY